MDIVKNVWPSDANFLFVEFMIDVYKKLKEKGIVVRDMSKVIACDNILRISVGLQVENSELIKQLTTIRPEYATK